MQMLSKLLTIQKLAENVLLLKGPNNIGVIIDDNQKLQSSAKIYLVDSGNNQDYAEKIITALNAYFKDRNYIIQAVIVTHGHSDHFGSCFWFKEKYNCEILIPEKESAVMNNPLIETFIIWGAFPLPEIRTPYFEATGCKPTRIISNKDKLQLNNGSKISFILLPGHHFDMLGVICTATDGKVILFAGDALFGKNHLKRYWTPFLFDVGQFKESLKKITELHADYYVPGHGNEVKEIRPLYELNMISTLSTENQILEILNIPMTTEELLKKFADKSKIKLAIGQYVLIGSTIRSYLSYLYKTAKITYYIKENTMFWVRNHL